LFNFYSLTNCFYNCISSNFVLILNFISSFRQILHIICVNKFKPLVWVCVLSCNSDIFSFFVSLLPLIIGHGLVLNHVICLLIHGITNLRVWSADDSLTNYICFATLVRILLELNCVELQLKPRNYLFHFFQRTVRTQEFSIGDVQL